MKCKSCEGHGLINCKTCTGQGYDYGTHKCDACSGSGVKECRQCDSKGTIGFFKWLKSS